MVWAKDHIEGLVQWVRNQHELLLIGRRGQFPATRRLAVFLAD